MKKCRYSLVYRIIAVMLTILCGTLTFFGTLGVIFTYEMGLYEKPLQNVIKEKQKRAQEIYSYQIYQHLEDIKQGGWQLNNTNMEYGVIQAEDLQNVDLSQRDSYLDYRFQRTYPDNECYSFRIDEEQDCQYKEKLLPSLTGYGFYSSFSVGTPQKALPVMNVVYNKNDHLFYMDTGSYSYVVNRIAVDSVRAHLKKDMQNSTKPKNTYIQQNEMQAGLELYQDLNLSQEELPLEGKAFFVYDKAKKKYVSASGQYQDLDTKFYREWTDIYLDAYKISGFRITSCYAKDLLPRNEEITCSLLSPYHAGVEDYDIISEDGKPCSDNINYQTFAVFEGDLGLESDTFWIVSKVKSEKDWEANDLFSKQKNTLTFLYNFRYAGIVATIISGIMTLLAGCFCLYSAGFRLQDQDAGTPTATITFWQRIPLEIFLTFGGALLVGTGSCLIYFLEELMSGNMIALFAGLFLAAAVAAILLVALVLCMNIAHRVHGRQLRRYTICHYFVSAAGKAARLIQKNFSLMIKGGLVLGGISLLEFFLLIMIGKGAHIFLVYWIIIKIAEVIFCTFVLLQLKSLQDGSAEIATGNLSYKLDTSRMMWEFKKHGENLNKIGDGMAIALEERMKSEYFKTELITNVSHDIKTPLTSIINYVDLLQKDSVTTEDRAEYLQVLDRQSKRLKKLIEDLIEASKASTGNLAVNMMPCNVDVLLTQTVGEFEEKLSASQLELIIKKPEIPVSILADSRHLWRVFDNLMNNICKYAQPGTRVYINQESDDSDVCIIFKNTSREQLNINGKELLERFVRGDSSRNTEGNGLGLSIAGSLMDLMDGSLEILVDGDLFKVILTFKK